MSNLVPTMADVAREAGVSMVSVDRVLDKRAAVRPATERKVLEAAQRLNFASGKVHSVMGDNSPPTDRLKPVKLVLSLLRNEEAFYQAIAALTRRVPHNRHVRSHQVYYLDGLSPTLSAQLLLEKGTHADATAIVFADHSLINQAVEKPGHACVWVYAFVSDITAAGCAGYVGIDNREAGRTAALAIARLSRRQGGRPPLPLPGAYRDLNTERVCWASVVGEMKRIVEREVASQIACASTKSFLLPLTKGLTNCGEIRLTLCPRAVSSRATKCSRGGTPSPRCTRAGWQRNASSAVAKAFCETALAQVCSCRADERCFLARSIPISAKSLMMKISKLKHPARA